MSSMRHDVDMRRATHSKRVKDHLKTCVLSPIGKMFLDEQRIQRFKSN